VSGVFANALNFCSSRPAGLDREYACEWLRVADLDGVVGCWVCVEICGKVGIVDGAVLAEGGPGLVGCPGNNAPGKLLVEFEGGWVCWGVDCWRFIEGAPLPLYS
jgi:hypothetical protein